ncbi:hypothetical protein BH23ACT7_BH23ACT7_11440 [soil metagenome]
MVAGVPDAPRWVWAPAALLLAASSLAALVLANPKRE